MGATGTDKLIALAKGLPLGSDNQANYSAFFDDIHNMLNRRSALVALTGLQGDRLQSDRKLALILACIWAMTQLREQNKRLILAAATVALEIMSSNGIAASSDVILQLMRRHRASFNVSGSMLLDEKYDEQRAEAAEDVLNHLRIGA
ncbi:hypothetical protein [Ktedonospora formicarum]|uniref:Uncharacterized protein n=1 Tax=Ktedonospora formicarum TaxID=2778364 RepID=A0A8J3I187_9CHLR|nr:hypothetical protein [Ktedonospora formicarum]GHO48152.1 hypothetical protein KSX_63150 [Ktedonospora formicarum]